jgi:hypothetical protein
MVFVDGSWRLVDATAVSTPHAVVPEASPPVSTAQPVTPTAALVSLTDPRGQMTTPAVSVTHPRGQITPTPVTLTTFDRQLRARGRTDRPARQASTRTVRIEYTGTRFHYMSARIGHHST